MPLPGTVRLGVNHFINLSQSWCGSSLHQSNLRFLGLENCLGSGHPASMRTLNPSFPNSEDQLSLSTANQLLHTALFKIALNGFLKTDL